MPFTGDTFTHLYDWVKDHIRQPKISDARLEAELDGVDTGLSAVAARATVVEADITALEAINATPYKVGSFTRDRSLATGTQEITGVGFQPKAIILFAAISGGSGQVSWGLDTASNRGMVYDNHGGVAGSFSANTGDSVRHTDGTNQYDGRISTFGADGFTISWVKTGSPTGTMTVVYMAMR